MIFIGVALLVAVGLALIISADAGTAIGLGQSQTSQLVGLVAILIFVAGGTFGRRRRLGELLANLLLWGGLFGLTIVGYTYRGELLHIADRVMAELSPGAAVVNVAAGTATFQRSLGGSFRVSAIINGAEMHMIFDTGASAIVLTQQDALAAGIDVSSLRYNVPVQTANGTGSAARFMLRQVDVGGIVREDVPAFIADEGALETSLLGMSFLERLSAFAVAGEALVLTD